MTYYDRRGIVTTVLEDSEGETREEEERGEENIKKTKEHIWSKIDVWDLVYYREPWNDNDSL